MEPAPPRSLPRVVCSVVPSGSRRLILGEREIGFLSITSNDRRDEPFHQRSAQLPTLPFKAKTRVPLGTPFAEKCLAKRRHRNPLAGVLQGQNGITRPLTLSIKVRLEAGLNETDGFKRWLTISRVVLTDRDYTRKCSFAADAAIDGGGSAESIPIGHKAARGTFSRLSAHCRPAVCRFEIS